MEIEKLIHVSKAEVFYTDLNKKPMRQRQKIIK